MTYIDLSLLFNDLTNSMLDAVVAEFLYKSNDNFLPFKYISSFAHYTGLSYGSNEFEFSHSLLKSGANQWHIIEHDVKGTGSYGVVYCCKHKIIVSYANQNYVAQIVPVDDVVKIQSNFGRSICHQTLYDIALTEARNQQEHRTNVVAVVDTGDKIATVVEDCGISLDKLLPFKPGSEHYSFMFRLKMAAHISNEMLLLQQEGKVHRDLKPANICYKPIPSNLALGIPEGQFRIIVIDFGLARPLEATSKRIYGTPDYMAPEVVSGYGYSYGSDMYAFAGILGEIFGASNILKYKDRQNDRLNRAFMPFCFDGLFKGYDISSIDPFLLRDLEKLLRQLQERYPENRPDIAHVNKFFALFAGRMQAYEKFNRDWELLTQHLDQLEIYYQQLDLLKEKYLLAQYQSVQLNSDNPLSKTFNRNLIDKKKLIHNEFAAFRFWPKSHYRLSAQLVKENRLVDFDGEDCPYPHLTKITTLIQEENSKLATALSFFVKDINASVGTVKLSLQMLYPEKSSIEKLRQLGKMSYKKMNSHERDKNENDNAKENSVSSQQNEECQYRM